MSTIRVANIQHPDAAEPAITLDANGDATIPSLPSDLGGLSDVDTTGAADGEALVFSSGSWAPAEIGGGGLEGTSYVFVAGDGTAEENGTALDDAYTAAKALTPYGDALADDNRAWVVVAPGIYDTTLEMDGQFVNVVSLDGDMSIRLTAIDVQADNVLVRGIDVGTANFLIGDDLAGLVAEKCAGGDFSFGRSKIASGTFVDCVGGGFAFGGQGTASGTFTNCTGGSNSFGTQGTASGTFINCTGGIFAFSDTGTASGTFINCTAEGSSFGGGFGTASGTFINCTAGGGSFGGAFGTFTNCTAGSQSFSYQGTASGTFTNCTGGSESFATQGFASGTFTNCTGGSDSFGGDPLGFDIGTLSGTVLYCRLTSGTFATPSGGGRIRLSLDGNFSEVNAG